MSVCVCDEPTKKDGVGLVGGHAAALLAMYVLLGMACCLLAFVGRTVCLCESVTSTLAAVVAVCVPSLRFRSIIISLLKSRRMIDGNNVRFANDHVCMYDTYIYTLLSLSHSPC